MTNSVRVVGGFNVACVGWLNKPYLVLENEDTFEDACKRDFVPIDHFGTQVELIERLYSVINNIKFKN